MVSRGEMAMILVSLGLETGVISAEDYGALVIVVIASTVVAPIMLKALIMKSREKESLVNAQEIKVNE